MITFINQRPLIDARVLVGARVLRQVVDVDSRLGSVRLVIVDADDDARSIDRVHLAAAFRDYGYARVDRHRALDAGADERRLRTQGRHGLALHVRAHERPVGVVVLEERDQRCRY